VLLNAVLALPALAAGVTLGIALFGQMNDVLFRRTVLTVLFAAGLGLVF
jgi:hypothetical protein